MNKHAYKVIFNKTTGRMDVVSEIVCSDGKSIGGVEGNQGSGSWLNQLTQFLFKPLTFALMLSLGTAQILPAQAQVIADPNAPKTQQATILPTASGATQINIQKPTEGGVSMNQYKQFDTQSNGTILNNSRTNTNTQTAGWIQGNPWLAGGTARIIVNQVNSSNPTHLTGNIEIAGNKAEVIISNPVGILVNGTTFLNASRTTLSTGKPIIENGLLMGHQVDQGQISIEGQGLNVQGSDYTDLLARAVKINAGIWGNNLAITTGVNRINADNSQATAGTSTGATPTVAIDTSALGGMYAGKITLVGTEKGVGVNNAGQIAASAGNVSIDINGMLSNSGTINANLDASGAAKTQIKSTHLKNTGTISSQGDTDIQTASLSNSATIAAGREAKLNATDLNNSTGTINGQRIDITANSLNNTQGKIQQTGAQALALEAGSINNANKGLIGYEPLDAGTGSGTGGTGTGAGTTPPPSTATGGGSSTVVQPAPVALADGQIKVTTSINNDAGQITANGGINLTAKNGLENHATLNLNKLKVTGDSLDNSSGSITTAQTDVATNSVNNVAGKIQTYGNSTISANQIDNTTGLIRSDLANKLTASSINNSNTQGTEQGIEGGTVAIQSNTLNNTKGAIRSKVDLTAEGMGLVNGSINNTQGLMSSNGTLNLKDNNSNTLAITNTAGQIISDSNNTVQAKSLTGDGTVTSNADLSITLNDDFNNTGTTTAVNNLTFTTAGNLTNSTALKAGSSATIKAQNIDNLANAEISSAKTQMTATDTLNNRGLIDGGDTIVKAATVNNTGTGRIYGDHIAIAVTTLNNTDETINGTNTAATIAARSQLDIGAQTINNREHATLFADGKLNIGGSLDASNLATGQANELNNESATVESTGDMNLSIKQINNRNMHFASEIQVVKQEGVSQVQGTLGEQVNGVAGAGSVSPLYSVDGSARTNLPSLGGEYGGNYTLNTQNNVYITPDQSNYLVTPEGGYREWNLRDYIRTTSESVVTSSDPSKITAGGNLTLATTELRNENSQVIVGGALQGDAQNIKNVETLGQRIVADNGTILYNARDYDKGRDEPAVWSDPYNTTHPTQSINISTALVQEHIAPTSTNTDAGTRDLSNLVMSTDGSNQIRTAPVNTNMPNSSLFTIDPNNSGYFIQTDPRFADYKNWLSSDWMLGALKLDPTTTHKRLGDGYYEQKLIREQVAQLTGRRYLSGQNNDETQYQALMQSGVTFAGQYNLRPGIALTAEQMAHLTSDIVWLVEQEVTLPNGNKVKALIPKVYVAVKPGDIDGSGSLLSANRINLNLTGDLNNSGTISGRTVTQITAENLNNLGGRITADQLNLKANSDINNVGGIIDANTSANLQAGRDINVTITAASGATGYGSATIIDRVAGIYVGTGANELIGQNTNINSLTLQAGRDVNLTAAQIDNAGTGGTRIDATNGNLNLATVTTSESERIYRDARNGFSTSSSNEIGSGINGMGNIALLAGKDVNARAADVNSQTGALSVQAGNDINITAGTSTRDTVVDAYQKQSGFLSSKKTTEHQDSSTQTSVASNFTGATVALNAGHDANITGSNAISDTQTSIHADNDVNILAATETSSSSNFKEVKKSGLTGGLSAGVLSVGYSKSKTTATNDNQSTTQAASTIASLDGDTKITAGNHLQISASDIAAGKDLTLAGKNVDIVAAQETNKQDSTYKSKTSGFSVGITVDPISAFKSAYKGTYDNTPATGTVGKVTRLAEAVGAGAKAATTPVVVTAGSHKTSTENHIATSDVRVSTVQAGGNLNIIATDGSIDSQGTQISAEGNALLLAKDNINLDVAHNYEAQTSDSKASGWGFDNRLTGIPIGVYNKKANGDGATDTTVGTNLSVGGHATLATTTGDINIIGSNAVSTGDMNLNAANNLNIVAAQNTAQNENHSNNKAIGKVVISDTERFMGYHAEKANNDNQTVTQVSSSVGSLSGNVNATAGNAYTQTASNVVAGNDVNVTAKSIDILTAQNTGDAHSDQSALKVGVFARVTSPIIDLVNNIDAAGKSDGRLSAMQGMAAAGNAYQAGSAIASMAGTGYGSGSILKAEVGVGIAINKSSDNSTGSTSVGNTLTAGNNVNLTSTAGDIHAQQADITAGKTIKLDSAQDILLDAGQSTSHSDGKHSNYGAEVGVGVEVGAKTGVYAYAAANAGKGKYNTDSVTHSNSHLNADNIQINSKGDTTLKGATATANSINTDVGGKLTIESLQDTSVQTSKETGVNARVQVSFGTAWEASGGVNASKANGDYAQVTEQSGLFAGDGGYHVKAKEVELTGGAISSTNAANSDLTADKFTHTDIQNHMDYDASSVSLSGSVGGTSSNKDGTKTTDSFKAQDLGGVSKGGLTPSLPMMDSGYDTSTTQATLTEGNVTIGGVKTTAAATGINTDASAGNAQIANLPNIQQLLADQKAMASAVGTIVATTQQISSDKADYAQKQLVEAQKELLANNPELKAQFDDIEQQKNQILASAGDHPTEEQSMALQAIAQVERETLIKLSPEYKAAFEDVRNWGVGGDYSRAMDAVTAIVTGLGSGQGGSQVATNALAPYAAQLIGSTVGHGDNKDTATQLLSHAVLGAVMAYYNGGNAVQGAVAGAGGEAAAEYLARELYADKHPEAFINGVFVPNLLPEDAKNNVLALTTAVSSLATATGGGGLNNAAVNGLVSRNAAKNNSTDLPFWEDESNRQWQEQQDALKDPNTKPIVVDIPKAVAQKYQQIRHRAKTVKKNPDNKTKTQLAGAAGQGVWNGSGAGDITNLVVNGSLQAQKAQAIDGLNMIAFTLSDAEYERRLNEIESIYSQPIDARFTGGDETTQAMRGLAEDATTAALVVGPAALDGLKLLRARAAAGEVLTAAEKAELKAAGVDANFYAEGWSSTPAGLNTTAGVIPANPNKTTTVLGRWASDMDSVINGQMSAVKTEDFGARPGGFNVLNVDDVKAAASPDFFEQYNRPFLDEAVRRGDDIALATSPSKTDIFRKNGELNGSFAKELQYLVEHNYKPVNVSAEKWNEIKGWFK